MFCLTDFETCFELVWCCFEIGFEIGFETGFETSFETGRVVLVVERSKRKNGSKRSQEMMMMGGEGRAIVRPCRCAACKNVKIMQVSSRP